MITERDRAAIQFVRDMGVATTSQIERAIYGGNKYSSVTARRRLAIITNMKLLKRTREFTSEEWMYWAEGKEPSQTDHRLMVTEVYVRLFGLPGRIDNWEREPDWGHLQPDAFCEFSRGDLHYLFALEVQRLTGNPFNQAKYEAFYSAGEWRKRWPKFPRVIVVSDRPPKITKTNIMFIHLPVSLNGIETIF